MRKTQNMSKSIIDVQALVEQFSEASTKQGEALRKAVGEATLKGLQARELTLKNIKDVLKSVTSAATKGAAANPASAVDVEAMLTKALAGMDGALLQAVEANRRALTQLMDQGATLRDGPLKKAMTDIEKMEHMMFATIDKAVQGVPAPMQSAWSHVLDASKAAGTGTGNKAAATVAELTEQTRAGVREGRAAGMKAAQALMDSYSALVSGVLIGMSEGLQGKTSGAQADKPRAGRARNA
jgi:hypothetical protein